MSDPNNEVRDRVRALVKQVLATVPSDIEQPPATAEHIVEHVVVISLQDKVGKEFDRMFRGKRTPR